MFPFFYLLTRRGMRALGIALLLGACTTVPDGKPGSSFPAAVDRPYHQAIDIGGRMSVRYQRNGTEESLHGSFSWEQTRDLTVVTLLSPLGQTLARIEITSQSAVLLQPGQAARIADDVDSLTAGALGWPLPVSGLQNWLQGFANLKANSALQAIPAENAVVDTADGWRLHFVNWQHDAQAYPRRLDLERSTVQAGEVHLRIVVDRWQPRG